MEIFSRRHGIRSDPSGVSRGVRSERAEVRVDDRSKWIDGEEGGDQARAGYDRRNQNDGSEGEASRITDGGLRDRITESRNQVGVGAIPVPASDHRLSETEGRSGYSRMRSARGLRNFPSPSRDHGMEVKRDADRKR